MKPSRYNIAIVGTGRIIIPHIMALRAIPEYNIAGIYGKDYLRAKQLAAQFGLKAFDDYRKVLTDSNIHIVDIATSSDLHAQYGLEAANHGKHLIIEKPIDVSVDKASQLVKLCELKKSLIGVIYQQRFDESIKLLKDLIDRGFFGKIISGSIIWRQKRDLQYYLDASDKCKGVLMNNGIHYIDLIIYLLGMEPHYYQGITRKTRDGLNVEDYSHILLEFKNSRMFSIDISTNVEKSIPTIIEIHGEKGSICFWGKKIKSVTLDIPRGETFCSKSYFKLFLARKYNIPIGFRSGSHENVFRNYINALRGNENLSVDGKTAIMSLKVVQDIYNQNGAN